MRVLTVLFLFTMLGALPAGADDEFFYCGFTLSDGSGQNYAKWGKGTDFKFNESENRWEWNSEYFRKFISPDGTFKETALVSYFDDQEGVCNDEMERIYKEKLKALSSGS